MLKSIQRKVRLRFARNSWDKKVLKLCFEFPGEVEAGPAGVFLNKLGIHLSCGSFEFLLDGYRHLRDIQATLNPKFYIEDASFFMEIENRKLNVTTAEEILIILEVFVVGSYNFIISPQSNVVMIDVGMNVGFASIFFASKDVVLQVYGFEPFDDTYNQAQNNFKANPSVANKIKHFNYGLSDKKEKLSVDYDYDNKGQVGIHGTSLIRGKVRDKRAAVINLRNASEEFNSIFNGHPGATFAAKIDCEGAEYAIVSDLKKSDLLRKLKFLLIEWHGIGPEPLLDLLTRSGFSSFFQQLPNKKVGMIYAIR